jgi:hypothetical protein
MYARCAQLNDPLRLAAHTSPTIRSDDRYGLIAASAELASTATPLVQANQGPRQLGGHSDKRWLESVMHEARLGGVPSTGSARQVALVIVMRLA